MLSSQATLILCGITVVYAKHIDVCTTRECKDTAERFLEYMDGSINPCEDFYGFTCGNFIKNTVISKSEDSASTFSKVQSTVNKQLEQLFNTSNTSNSAKGYSHTKTLPFDEEIYKTPRKYYDLCMDEASINARGVKPALEIFAEAGGWPVLEKHSEEGKRNYSNSTVWPDIMDVIGLLDIDVETDLVVKHKRIISIGSPNMYPPKEYLAQGPSNNVVRAYYKFLVDVAVAFGADKLKAESEQNETLSFTISLAKIIPKAEDLRNISKIASHISLAKLKEQWDWFDWERVLNRKIPQGVAPLSNTDEVLAMTSYLTKLGRLIKKFPKRVVKNYKMSRLVQSMGHFLSKDVEELFERFERVISGVQTNIPRWRRCLSDVSSFFSVAISSLYVKQYFNKQSKMDALNILKKIQKEMVDVLGEAKWMDDKTRSTAQSKALATIVEYAGYPPQLLDDNEMKSYYKTLRMNESYFLEAMLDLSRWSVKTKWLELREPVDRLDWRNHADVIQVNAFFQHSINSVDIPASILQTPFFNAKLPEYLNLATMGNVVGHEFTHGFDDVGRQFNSQGGLEEWWSPESLATFNKQKQCIIDQYGSFNDTKQTLLKVNGMNVQGEAIADNGGLKLAYRVFKNMSEMDKPTLPSFERYTPEQLFFIGFGNLWCEKVQTERLKYIMLTDGHPPSEFRVKGALQNFEPFSKAFSCRLGSEMNPEKKCRVW